MARREVIKQAHRPVFTEQQSEISTPAHRIMLMLSKNINPTYALPG
jgi:hypothetical protein